MNIIVAVIGWMIVAEGLLGIARPHLLLTAVANWPSDLRLYITVGSRIVIVLLLFLAAPHCRFPRSTSAIGVITFVAGIVYAFLGASRLGTMIQFIATMPSETIQLIYILAVIFGAFLVYSGCKETVV